MIKIKDIKYDSDWEPGCPTCDWGSLYISNIKILFEDDTELLIETNQMYEYMFSESDCMKALGNSNNVDEIILNLLNIIDAKSYNLTHRISLQDMHIKINDKEIDILNTFYKKKITY